jgi:hypothetical protein
MHLRVDILLRTCVLAIAPALRAAAQSPVEPATDGRCTYERCALSIAPVWNGLALVRGVTETRVANLGFFWAHPLDHVFVGHDSAARYAANAVRVRRSAAVLTDAGGLLIAYTVGRRLARGQFPRDAQVAAAVGAASVGISVPLQFAADGHLSRAIWWHNRQYAR